MKAHIKFDKPQGFITVTNGSRKWVLSKEEAKDVFVTTGETQTLMGGIGSLFIAFLTLLPVEQRSSVRYEVKIRTKSGEEIRLLKSQNVDLAEDIVKRIVTFSTKTEAIKNAANTKIVDSIINSARLLH